MTKRPFFSICIPAYNRSEFLVELLDSIVNQSFKDFEVIISEDLSPERHKIKQIAEEYQSEIALHIILNERNLGYDKNLRTLITAANGRFIFFLGNDDVLGTDALELAFASLTSYSSVTAVIRGYSVFKGNIEQVDFNVNYFNDTVVFNGGEKFAVGVRRFGVLSGLIFDTYVAKTTLTDIYDGSLYYQTYLGIECLKRGDLLYLSGQITHSRAEVAPDFGNSDTEKMFTPGSYTVEARYEMIAGVTNIYKSALDNEFSCFKREVEKDYASYMLAFFKDQLNLKLFKYFWLWRSVGKLGYNKYIRYHLIIWLFYLSRGRGMTLGEKCFRFMRSIFF